MRSSESPLGSRRFSLHKLSIWTPILGGLALIVGVAVVAMVSFSVIRLSDYGGQVMAAQRMAQLRGVGNLERLIALGDQLDMDEDSRRWRTTVLTMEALIAHPSITSLDRAGDVTPRVQDGIDAMTRLRAREAAATDALRTELRAEREAIWQALRIALKGTADDVASDMVGELASASEDISRGARVVMFVTIGGAIMVVILSLLTMFVVRRHLLHPLMAISDYLVGLRKGIADDAALPRADSAEVGLVVDAVAQLADAQRALEQAALYDPLTGLSNRYGLETRVDQMLAYAHRHGLRIAVMFIDLDRFKTINDSVGHTSGDRLLKIIADRFVARLRETDLVARPGGDEFVVVLSDVLQLSDVASVAGKLLEAARQPVHIDSMEIMLSASIGISLFPDDGNQADELVKHADIAMYHAKAQGRANYQFFDEAMNRAATTRLQLESELRQALERGEFRLHFQPQMDAAGEHIVAVEALIRWLKADGQLVAPAAFIGVAEECGLIVPIGAWVLRSACEHLAAWREMGVDRVRVAVNLSVLQLLDRNLPEQVARLIEVHGIPPELLEMEITESAAMADPDATVASLQALKAQGVSLAIDDFGTGYSSLSYLRLFPIDRLKLDRAFVGDLSGDSNAESICSATVSLAHSMKLQLVAEGVETAEQFGLLRGLGCDLLQGYYFYRPMSGDDFVRLWRRRNGAGAPPTQTC